MTEIIFERTVTNISTIT